MDAFQVAARFTAFTCYLNADTDEPPSPEEAGRFAREYWKRFLPFVDRDLARFLARRPRNCKVRHAGSSAAATGPVKARAAG
jgi:hypothetical protein